MTRDRKAFVPKGATRFWPFVLDTSRRLLSAAVERPIAPLSQHAGSVAAFPTHRVS